MEDQKIIGLYLERTEDAIVETKNKYSRLLVSISYGILKNVQDAQECENDTYLRTWNLIPPKRPDNLRIFLSKIVRNLSLDRYDFLHAEKRGGDELPMVLDELAEVVGEETSFSEQEEGLTMAMNEFLGSLTPKARNIFMRRYWFGDSIQDIACFTGYGASRIKMSLMRSRQQLRELLLKEGFCV